MNAAAHKKVLASHIGITTNANVDTGEELPEMIRVRKISAKFFACMDERDERHVMNARKRGNAMLAIRIEERTEARTFNL